MTDLVVGADVQAHTRAAPPNRRKRHILGEGYRSLCGMRPKGGWDPAEVWREPCSVCQEKASRAEHSGGRR